VAFRFIGEEGEKSLFAEVENILLTIPSMFENSNRVIEVENFSLLCQEREEPWGLAKIFIYVD